MVLLDRALVEGAGSDRALLTELSAQAALVGVGENGETEPPDVFPAELLSGYFAADTPLAAARVTLHGALRHAAALVAAQRATRLEGRSASDVAELSRIGVALSTERDLLALLDLILSQARRLSSADAGSLYLVERHDHASPTLRQARAESLFPNLPFSEAVIPLDHASLAGHAA